VWMPNSLLRAKRMTMRAQAPPSENRHRPIPN
jgi:hypothetical protein